MSGTCEGLISIPSTKKKEIKKKKIWAGHGGASL
jgi:hypothetical protein